MRQFADLTEEARECIVDAKWEDFAILMNKNFELRKQTYGHECIGRDNLRMIEIGQSLGAACKFPGSGGAILGLLLDHDKFEDLRHKYEEEGFVVTKLIPNL